MLTDEQLIEFHAQDRSIYSIAKEYGIPSVSLDRRYAKLGLSASHRAKIRKDKIKDKTDEILQLHKEGMSRGEMAKKFDCAHISIANILKKHGLGGNIKTWDYDDTFFDVVDTEAKAYTLGFFTADGCNRSNSMAISVADPDIVEKIAKAMQYTGPIHQYQPSEKRGPRKLMYKLAVNCTKLCDSLTRLGCPPKKSFVTKFPTLDIVPAYLLPHYIRGVFDGDGSLYHTSNGWHICIAGTKELLDPMLEYIRKETGIHVGGVYKAGNIWTMRIPGIRNTTNVLNWLYKDATIYLDRKHILYLEMRKSLVSLN